jgi:indole-3-glycerol phosphate synthase
MISESGLQNPKSLRHLRELGFGGFLIGEALMRAPDPEAALRDFTASAEDGQEGKQAEMASDTDALQV